MRHRIAIVLAAGALALVAAATAQAAPAGADAGNDQGTVVYLTCTDGTTYTIDTSEFDPNQVAPSLCPDGYTVSDTPPDANSPTADTGDNSLTGTSGVDVGIDAPSNQQPDPTLYSTQVQCPDGTIWAVAIGDSFTCP